MTAILGKDAKLYRQTTGTRATWPATGAAPNLDLVGNVRNLTLNLTSAEADATTRASNGWKVTLPTTFDGSVEFEMIADPGDADFVAIRNAFFNRTNIAMAALTGDSTVEGVEGLWADFRVTAFTRNEDLEDVVKHNVTLKPGYSAVAPEWAEVAEA